MPYPEDNTQGPVAPSYNGVGAGLQTDAYNPFGSSSITATTPSAPAPTAQPQGAFSPPSITAPAPSYTGTPQQPNAQYSYDDKVNLWKQSGLPMSSFDLDMFNRDANSQMYIKRDAFLQENDRQNTIQNPQATPEQVQQYQNEPAQAQPIQEQPTTTSNAPGHLFDDEKDMYKQMTDAGVDPSKANQALEIRRYNLLDGNTKLAPNEAQALLTMQANGIPSDKAVDTLKIMRQNEYDALPGWKKAGQAGVNTSVGLLSEAGTQVGNVLDWATLGKAGFGQQTQDLQNATKFATDTTAGKIGAGIFGAGEMAVGGDLGLSRGLIAAGKFVGAGTKIGNALKISGEANGIIAGSAKMGLMQGAVSPILNEGSKATAQDIATSAGEGLVSGAVTGGLLKGAGVGAGWLGDKLQLSGLLNPARLSETMTKLITEDGEKAPGDVAKWMTERGMTGTKGQIVDKLVENAQNSKKAVDEALSGISARDDIPEVRAALTQTEKDLTGIAGQEDNLARVKQLLSQGDYSLSEANEAKRIIDKQYNLYKQSGDPIAGQKAEGLQNIRNGVKTFIEDKAAENGVPNLRMMNNETAVSYALANGIQKKESADYIRSILSGHMLGGVIGYETGYFDGNTTEGRVGNVLTGMLIGKTIDSTFVKTKVASILHALSGRELTTLEGYFKSGGKTQVSENLKKKVEDTIYKSHDPEPSPRTYNPPKEAPTEQPKQNPNRPAYQRGNFEQGPNAREPAYQRTRENEVPQHVQDAFPGKTIQSVGEVSSVDEAIAKANGTHVPQAEHTPVEHTTEEHMQAFKDREQARVEEAKLEQEKSDISERIRGYAKDGTITPQDRKLYSLMNDGHTPEQDVSPTATPETTTVSENGGNSPAPTPETGKSGTTQQKMNFTQFAKSKGLPSDYEIADKNAQAHKEFEDAIRNGEVVDADGKITKDSLEKSESDRTQNELLAKIRVIDGHIKQIEGLGKMSHKSDGTLKASYQRTVDEYNRQKEKLTHDNLQNPKNSGTMGGMKTTTTIHEELKPLAEEARKYKSAEEFEKDYTASNLMDISTPNKHRFGRLLEDGVDTDTGRYMDAKYTADLYGSRGDNQYKYEKGANVPDVKSKDEMVTIYRSTSKKQMDILPGDFVSFSKEYAESHDRGHTISIKVPAKDVVFQLNDLHEWIYSPEALRGDKYTGGLKSFWNTVHNTK